MSESCNTQTTHASRLDGWLNSTVQSRNVYTITSGAEATCGLRVRICTSLQCLHRNQRCRSNMRSPCKNLYHLAFFTQKPAVPKQHAVSVQEIVQTRIAYTETSGAEATCGLRVRTCTSSHCLHRDQRCRSNMRSPCKKLYRLALFTQGPAVPKQHAISV